MKNVSINKENFLIKKSPLIFLILFFCLNMRGQVCFTTTSYWLGYGTEAIASGDFNSDGKPDIVCTSYIATDSLMLLLGDGLGGFGTVSMPCAGAMTHCLISADFNKDGKDDVAFINFNAVGLVEILFGNGAAGFPTRDSFLIGDHPSALCSADFNGDGNLDIAATNVGSHNISVILGNGNGQFTAHVDFSVGNDPASVCSGDFNGDGKADLAVANDNGGGPDSVYVLLGNGAGSFGVAAKYKGGDGQYSVCSKDFNADGFDDIATANCNSDNFSVFMSQGTSGTFVGTNYPAGLGSEPTSIVSADFDGDGKFDLATANYGGTGGFYAQKVGVMLGAGNGTFSVPSVFNTAGGPWAIITADFNVDGKPDLATANHGTPKASVLINCAGVGIENFSGDSKEILVYPNPSSGSFSIETNSNAKQLLQIYDSNGKIVLNQTISGKTILNAGNLAEGIFNIRISDQEAVRNKRIIITK